MAAATRAAEEEGCGWQLSRCRITAQVQLINAQLHTELNPHIGSRHLHITQPPCYESFWTKCTHTRTAGDCVCVGSAGSHFLRMARAVHIAEIGADICSPLTYRQPAGANSCGQRNRSRRRPCCRPLWVSPLWVFDFESQRQGKARRNFRHFATHTLFSSVRAWETGIDGNMAAVHGSQKCVDNYLHSPENSSGSGNARESATKVFSMSNT